MRRSNAKCSRTTILLLGSSLRELAKGAHSRVSDLLLASDLLLTKGARSQASDLLMTQEKDGAGVKPAIKLVDRQDARELDLINTSYKRPL